LFLVTPMPRGRVVARRVHAAPTDLETTAARNVTPADLAGFETVLTALQQAARGGRHGRGDE